MEPLSPYFGDDMKFNTEVSDLDTDHMMQWNIESCFGNGNIVTKYILLSVE